MPGHLRGLHMQHDISCSQPAQLCRYPVSTWRTQAQERHDGDNPANDAGPAAVDDLAPHIGKAAGARPRAAHAAAAAALCLVPQRRA